MATDEPDVELAAINDDPPTPAGVRPQLRLHHLFALTAVAAVLLAIDGPQSDYWSQMDVQLPRLMLTLLTAWNVVYVLLISVAVTAIAYGIYWQRQGLLFFDQPGHWLLVEIGVIGMMGLVPGIVYRWLFATTDLAGPDFPMVTMIIVSLYSLAAVFALPLALNIYIGIRKCRETRWSVVFYFKAVANLMFGIGAIVVLILLLIAANRDQRERTPRDAAHWCGVWLQLAFCILHFGSGAFGIFNMFYMMARM